MEETVKITNNLPAIQSGARFAFAALIAFIFYHLFDLQFGYWAVVSVAAVMRPNYTMTSAKALLRLMGTLIGVVIGYLAISCIKYFPASLYIVFFISMFITGLLIFAKRKYRYSGIVCGITIIIIITTVNQQGTLFYDVIVDRTLDVTVGILIAWICSKLFFPVEDTQEKETLSLPKPPITSIVINSAIMACATVLSLIPWFYYHYSGGYWAPIACLFIIEENFDKTQKNAITRFFAHVIVIFLAAIFSFLGGTSYSLGIALVIGMFIFGYWMRKPLFGFDSTIANSMAIAYCIVLLIAPGEENIIESCVARFVNTVLGILVGMIVVNFLQPEKNKPL